MASEQTTALKAAATSDKKVAKDDRPNIMTLLGAEKNRKQMGALVGKYMTGEKMLALCVNAIRKTPDLAYCDPQSVLGAFMACSALGLEPNTLTGQCYLIPYKKNVKMPNGTWVKAFECQLQIGYKGYITLAMRSPDVLSIEAEAIHENDVFEHMQGSQSFLKFQKALKDRGELIGAYCLVKMKNGAEIAVTLPLEEIEKVRDKSETYKSLVKRLDEANTDKDRATAQKKLDDTPWVMWEDDMAAKTPIKKLISKRLNLSANDPMSIAGNLDERNINLAAFTDPKTVSEVFDYGAEPPALEEQHGEYVPTQIHEGEMAEVHEEASEHGESKSAQTGSPGTSEKTAPEKEGAPKVEFAVLRQSLQSVSSEDDLNIQADLIQHLHDNWQREECSKIYKAKLQAFRTPHESPKGK